MPPPGDPVGMRTEDLDDFVDDLANVVGWEWDEDDGVARVYVTEKVPEAELAGDDVVNKVLSAVVDDVDVVPVGGEFRPEVVDDRFHPHGDVVIKGKKQARHRPVEDGVSEINAKSTAATAGYFRARVVDTDAATWHAQVRAGDAVRLSNNHVYARSNKAALGEPIVQPSPRDGGDYPDDLVGGLVGYVPIADGVTVDIAARSTDAEGDSVTKHDLPDGFGTGVRRDYRGLKGETVTKTGRTTGVTTGDVVGTSATIRVRYPNGRIKVRDCILTTGMSQGGDSGSDVFDEDGRYVGALFAGSPSSTVVCKVSNIEAELGVEVVPRSGDPPDGPPDDGDGDDTPGSFFAWVWYLIARLLNWLRR